MKNLFKIISFVLILSAVVGGVYLVMKNQEIRRGATANATSTSVLPANVSTKTGDNFNVHVWVNTGADTDKLVGAEFIVKFDPALIKYVSSSIVPNNYEILNEVSADNGELEFKIVSMSGEKSGAVDLVKLNFKSLGGAGKIEVKTGGKVMISGQADMWDIATNNLMNYSNATGTTASNTTPTIIIAPYNLPKLTLTVKDRRDGGTKLIWEVIGNRLTCTKSVGWSGTVNSSGEKVVYPKNTTIYSMECTNTNGTSGIKSVTVIGSDDVGNPPGITVTPTAGDGTVDPTLTSVPDGTNFLLNYKMSFGNISASNAKCLVDWPFKIMVMSNGITKTFIDVLPQSQSVLDNKLIFSGTLTLDGFNQSSNVAVFVSGPQHLQMKYGMDLQTSSYNQAGGSLTLTKTDEPVYDFSGYPLVPGDVVSNVSEDEQDGIINGVDYAYVKSRSLTHLTVDEGEFLKGDLNGDCQVNSGDIIVIKSSLQERQGQLY